jgi:hypothetical protein
MGALNGCSCRAESSARKGAAMRSVGHSVFVLTVLGSICASGEVWAQGAAKDATPATLLKFRPSQAGVEYDTPADEATRNACKVEPVSNAEGKSIGYALRDPQGKMLRRFVTARGRRMDQWSYYQDGFEVYREDDLNGAQLRRQSYRAYRAGKDRGLEADLGRGGVEGTCPGSRGR